MPHFTMVFVTAAMTIAFTATLASPLFADSAMESAIALTSVRPASAARTYTLLAGQAALHDPHHQHRLEECRELCRRRPAEGIL